MRARPFRGVPAHCCGHRGFSRNRQARALCARKGLCKGKPPAMPEVVYFRLMFFALAPKAKQDTAMAKRRLAFEDPVHFAGLPE